MCVLASLSELGGTSCGRQPAAWSRGKPRGGLARWHFRVSFSWAFSFETIFVCLHCDSARSWARF